MDDRLFAELIESASQAAEIVRGEREASRAFELTSNTCAESGHLTIKRDNACGTPRGGIVRNTVRQVRFATKMPSIASGATKRIKNNQPRKSSPPIPSSSPRVTRLLYNAKYLTIQDHEHNIDL